MAACLPRDGQPQKALCLSRQLAQRFPQPFILLLLDFGNPDYCAYPLHQGFRQFAEWSCVWYRQPFKVCLTVSASAGLCKVTRRPNMA
jgi:hypothetical protein